MSHSDYQAYNFHEWSSKSKTNDCNTKYRRNGRQHVWQGHLLSNKQLWYWCITLKFWFALRSQASFRAKLNIWGWQKTDKVINLEKTWSVYGTDRSFKLLLTYNLRNKCLYSLEIFNMIKQQITSTGLSILENEKAWEHQRVLKEILNLQWPAKEIWI